MGSTPSLRCKAFYRITLSVAASVAVLSAFPSGAKVIYSCIDDKGRRITSDRPVPECLNRDQRLLNRDGSVKAVLPPAKSAEERAEMEAHQRKLAAEEMVRQDALRRDRNLLRRFPNEESHHKARSAALGDLHKSVERSERRLAELAAERKPLDSEAEFYKNVPMPGKLRQQLDANDASVDAQRSLVQNQQSEMVRINAYYDMELGRLKQLWAGAAPGSLGPLPMPTAESVSKAQATQAGDQVNVSPASSSTAR
jgi:hypothetical protein